MAKRLAAVATLLLFAATSQAGAAFQRFCDVATRFDAADHDRLLRFAAVARQLLEDSGGRTAIVARSGLALERFDVRYSHAGLSLKANAQGPWSVRQLYYACDEGRPRVYDQGMAGFVLGSSDARLGYLSILILPDDEGGRLERTALDRDLALGLLGATYSANAYAYGLRYQNCNQWLIELIAAAWAPLALGGTLRESAQAWLAAKGYVPMAVELRSHLLMAAAPFVPWLHTDDHPEDDLFALRFRVSLPEAIETFVRQRVPGARRIELCHDGRRIVVRHGWVPIEAGCTAAAGDTIHPLDG